MDIGENEPPCGSRGSACRVTSARKCARNMITVFLLQNSPIDSTSGQPSNSQRVELQNEIYNKLLRNNTHPADTHWIQESEVMALRAAPSSKAVFVLPVFDGDVFNHLKSLNCRIYGSNYFLQSMSHNRSLPNHFSPIYSSALEGVVVCFTGLSFDERGEKAALVEYLGGRVCRQFDNSVTHLVAETCDPSSDKYRATRKLKLPVLAPTWIDELWRMADEGADLSDAVLAATLKAHTLPIFRGCVITVSGFDATNIIQIGQLVERHGGVYSGEMSKAACTHLIAARNSGNKFHRAIKWGTVKIVDLKWLKKSVELAHRLAEDRFSRVEGGTAAVPSLSWATTPPMPPPRSNAVLKREVPRRAVVSYPETSNVVEVPQPKAFHVEAPHLEVSHAEVPYSETSHVEALHLGAPQPETSHVEASHLDMPQLEASHAEMSHPETSYVEASNSKEPAAGGDTAKSPPKKKTLSVFDIVEKSAKEAKEQEEKRKSLSHSNGSVVLAGDKRRRTSMAGTIRTPKNFGVAAFAGGGGGPTMTTKAKAQLAASVNASPAKLPGEELDSSQKDKSVMEWVEQCARQREEIENGTISAILGDATNLQRRKLAKPKNISTPLGDMVVNMHQQLLSKPLPLRATEFKKEILAVIDKYELLMFDETTK